jgi:glucokinase
VPRCEYRRQLASEPLRFSTPSGREELLDRLVGVVDQLDCGKPEAVDGIGIGLPGWVDENGCLRFAPNLPQLAGLHVAAELSRRSRRPVFAENDATCAAWGEYEAGTGLNLHSMVFITIGTGIGSGIVSDG